MYINICNLLLTTIEVTAIIAATIDSNLQNKEGVFKLHKILLFVCGYQTIIVL